jgi:hypothetical protein
VSRICEEFHCLPDAARRAFENDTNGSIFRILDYRSLANAKARIDHANSKNMPTDAAATRYLELQMGIVGEELGVETDDD